MKRIQKAFSTAILLVAAACLAFVPQAAADQVILDDLIVDGSACIGQDCVNGESFGFDTIRIKENNLRIRAVDTSSTSSFPSRDWQITFNDSANGGANKFSIDDIDAGRTPFTIEGEAPSHSLYVDDGGRIGLGTSTPVVDVHVKSGNTPTLRLEQDGSSGFTPQTWDVAGNEAGFFIRDATNGSTLPFRIRPGAPSSAIDIAADGDVGIGTDSPQVTVGRGLHIKGTNTNKEASLGIGDNPTWPGNCALNFTHQNGIGFITTRACSTNSGNEKIRFFVGASERLAATNSGIEVTGTITQNAGVIHPDYVFQPGYQLESIEDHSRFMWEKSHLPAVGEGSDDGTFEVGKTTMGILEELEKAHIYIERLNEQLKEKKVAIAQLNAKLREEGTQLANVQGDNASFAKRLARLEALLLAEDR